MNERIRELVHWSSYPQNLQNPTGRTLITASEVLKHHGYAFLAQELRQFGNLLIEVPPDQALIQDHFEEKRDERTNSRTC